MSEARCYEIEIAGSTDGGDRIPDLSPREAQERWLAKPRVSKRESTVSAYHYQLKLFVEWCENEGITSIAELTGWDLETYETHRREQGIKPLSLSKELQTLKLFLGYCARVELVDEGLPEKVDPPDVERSAHVNETRLHNDQAEALFEYYDRHAYGTRAHAVLALTWFTGARSGALRGLDLRDYDSESEVVQFFHRPRENTPLKNGRDGERAVGITDYVCDVLNEYIDSERYDVYDGHGRAPLFASTVGRPSRSAFRSWCYLATVPCLHSSCPHGEEPETCEYLSYSTASKCPSSRSPHQIRTGTITWQLNRGIPVEVVAKRVNTSVRVLKRHYDQPTKMEDLEERRRHHLHRLSFDEERGSE